MRNYDTASAAKLLQLNERSGVIEENKHMCRICGHVYYNSYTLRRHMISHTDETPFSCFYCESQFQRKEQLRGHCIKAHEMTREEFDAKAVEVYPPVKRGRPKKDSV